MMLVTLLCVACVASYAFGGERSVLPPAVLCDVSSSERTQLVVSAEGGTTSDLSNSFPFPTSPDDLEQLAGESWFTAFAYSREPCSRFCAELPFRNSSIRFHCAGTCDGSGSQPCVCDERPNLSARACTRHWGTKMCNCTRSAALEVASSLGMDALTTEPAFLVRVVAVLARIVSPPHTPHLFLARYFYWSDSVPVDHECRHCHMHADVVPFVAAR